MKNSLREIEIINLGFNSWNGFYFSFIGIELSKFSGQLFGLNFASDIILISVFFCEFEINLK